MKTVMTISGIRPDFIRMSEIFKKLDKNFNHILVHTGQHYDELLSGIFFKELNIRKPDYTLNSAKGGHEYQLSYLSTSILELIRNKNINPDIILFLGDSNTVCAALPLRKEGYIIGHIEAGMRSFDKRMLEEINRTICDHCSHIHFVYHPEYKKFLENENIYENVHVVGNTIVEVCKQFIPNKNKRNNSIILDIHRPENFKFENRLKNIIEYANKCIEKYKISVKMLDFKRTTNYLKKYNIDIGKIELVDLMGYKEYLNAVYNCLFIISDSGTAQEEPAILGTPVIVPRDFTERPQSLNANCSYMLDVNTNNKFSKSWEWLEKIKNKKLIMDIKWLGEGNTSELIINNIKKFLDEDKMFSLKNIKINKDPFPYFIKNNILPVELANKIQAEILNIEDEEWDRYNNPFENKYTLRNKNNLPPNVNILFNYLMSDKFITELSTLYGIKLYNDPTKNWWGIHKYDNGDKLDIHVDAGIHPVSKQKKQVTLGIYFSKDWKEENGGHLEIWKGENSIDNNAKLIKCKDKILPLFNTLISFECNDYSWHGNPHPVICKNGEKRIFLTISYVSENYNDLNKREKAFFVKHPEEPENIEKDKLRLLRADHIEYKKIYNINYNNNNKNN